MLLLEIYFRIHIPVSSHGNVLKAATSDKIATKLPVQLEMVNISPNRPLP